MPLPPPLNKFLVIALATPLRKTFHYLPGEHPATIKAGCRVRVPFGKQKLVGIFLEYAQTTTVPESKLRNIIEVIDTEPVISSTMLDLCQWAANYYHHSPGEVFSAAIPKLLRSGSAAEQQLEILKLTESGVELDLTAAKHRLSRAVKQCQLVALLQQQPALNRASLKAQGISTQTVRSLLEKQLVEWQTITHKGEDRDYDQQLIRSHQHIEPNQWQLKALDEINKSRISLLHGITGSGKTEVYLRAIEETLKQKKQALVLVPEIGLTPQTLSRFTDRFNVNIEVLHSRLSDKDRLKAWRNAGSGEASIIIGTRSAIFTPMKYPGLLIVDEEHDGSFKQHTGFRYSARDLAVKRAQLEKIPVILGSATPSIESLHNCQQGKYQLITLPHRTRQAEKESYQVISLRNKQSYNGLAAELIEQIRTELGQGNQVLVFINRRGFAPVLYCNHCQWIATCQRCDARLTYHSQQRKLVCHHCASHMNMPNQCPECHSSDLAALGAGTQRIEEYLTSLFPEYPVLRIDRDSTTRKNAMSEVIRKINQGEPTIMVGTQLLAKGHHFPNVTLVAMLDIDSGFFSADYKALERTGQLILQVGGRAGREAKKGRVILQTEFASQPLLKLLLTEGYTQFANAILQDRKLNALPPFCYHCLFRAEAPGKQTALAFLEQLAEHSGTSDSVEVLGPVPASMAKRDGRYRAQLLLASNSRKPLHDCISEKIIIAEQSKLASKVRWSVDVDPIDLF